MWKISGDLVYALSSFYFSKAFRIETWEYTGCSIEPFFDFIDFYLLRISTNSMFDKTLWEKFRPGHLTETIDYEN